jgi:hypothetical protein
MSKLTHHLDAGFGLSAGFLFPFQTEDGRSRYTDLRAIPLACLGTPIKYGHDGLRMLLDRLLTYFAFPVF